MDPKGKRQCLDKSGEVSIKKEATADVPASEWENSIDSINMRFPDMGTLHTNVDDHRENRLGEFLEKEVKVVVEARGTKYVSGFLKSGVPPAACTLHTNLAFAPIIPTTHPPRFDDTISKPPLIRKSGQFPLNSDSTFQQTMNNMAEENRRLREEIRNLNAEIDRLNGVIDRLNGVIDRLPNPLGENEAQNNVPRNINENPAPAPPIRRNDEEPVRANLTRRTQQNALNELMMDVIGTQGVPRANAPLRSQYLSEGVFPRGDPEFKARFLNGTFARINLSQFRKFYTHNLETMQAAAAEGITIDGVRYGLHVGAAREWQSKKCYPSITCHIRQGARDLNCGVFGVCLFCPQLTLILNSGTDPVTHMGRFHMSFSFWLA